MARRQHKSMAMVETEIAEVVEYSRSMIKKWRQGEYWPKEPGLIERLVRYCLSYGRVDRAWTESVLTQTHYPARDQLLAELFPKRLPSSEPVVPSEFLSPTGSFPPSGAFKLEPPGAIVAADSPFYIERPMDRMALATIAGRGGVTLVIKAPRQMGKTSLLQRLCRAAKQMGKKVALLDFQQFDRSDLAEGETFFPQFCRYLSDLLDAPDQVERYWDNPLGNVTRCTRYLSHYLLKTQANSLVLAMDEVDQIFEAKYRDDFFGMLRSWHSRRPVDLMWQRFDLVLATSTEPYLFIQSLERSIFNVGEVLELTDFTPEQVAALNLKHSSPQVRVIELTDFTPEQVAALNLKHGSPLTEAEVQKLFDLLHGQPYLVRLALYLVAAQGFTAARLFDQALADQGPFGAHLRELLARLYPHPELLESLRQVITGRTCSNEQHFLRLRGAGLVRRGQGREVFPRCQLYDDFFRNYFNGQGE